jgi:hypothetical protein
MQGSAGHRRRRYEVIRCLYTSLLVLQLLPLLDSMVVLAIYVKAWAWASPRHCIAYRYVTSEAERDREAGRPAEQTLKKCSRQRSSEKTIDALATVGRAGQQSRDRYGRPARRRHMWLGPGSARSSRPYPYHPWTTYPGRPLR